MLHCTVFNISLMCVSVTWLFVHHRADSDRASPHANVAHYGKSIPPGHAGRASAGPQHCACNVPLLGPADQDTFPFSGTAYSATQQQPASWIYPQLHHLPTGRHTIRAGELHEFLQTMLTLQERTPTDHNEICVI